MLGAGDAFMSGLLRGWLGGETFETAATWANACGAFAVSRLLCAPEYPTFEELQFFLENGSKHHALRRDEAINHIHWATTRRSNVPSLMAFACDHRAQLEDIAKRAGADVKKIEAFKVLAVKAAAKVAGGRDGYGMLLDEKYGRSAMFEFARHPFSWLGRPVEQPGSRPLRFEFSQDIGSQLVEWPVDHCIKALCFYHPEIRRLKQEAAGLCAVQAAQGRRELLVRDHRRQHGSSRPDCAARAESTARHQARLVEAGAASAGGAVIASNDPWCRGVVLLGLDAPRRAAGNLAAPRTPIVKGFAVGAPSLPTQREMACRQNFGRAGGRKQAGA